jgi:hypothetical protein
MINYEQWEEKRLPVTSLLLDPVNPRIPSLGAMSSQRDLIAELVEHDKVYELAARIVAQGYYPTEMIIAVKSEAGFVIVEGNRRLAALKLLISPDSAPEEKKAAFTALAAHVNPSQLAKVRVVIAPSRDAAAPLIMSRHTHNQIESWSPAMKARFYRSLMDRGITQQMLMDQYGATADEIADALRMDTLYRMAVAMPLPAVDQEKVHNPRTFPLTTLERIVVSAPGQKFLGIEFTDQDSILGKINVDEFKKGFKKLISDVANGEVTSRLANSASDIQKYLDRLPPDCRPDLKKKGKFTPANILSRAQQPKIPLAPNQKRRLPSRSPSVIPRSFKCGLMSQRIVNLFSEMRKLKVEPFPNATAVLLRMLLELSVSYYLDRTGKIEPLRKREEAKKGKNWYPTLKQMLAYILQDDTDLTLNRLQRRALNLLIQTDDSPVTLDSLDSLVHNRYVAPNERELRAIWERLEPFFEYLFVEHTPTPQASKP